MHALATNLLQVGMLGLGVSLLLLWINYLKEDRERDSSDEREDQAADFSAVSATRSRTGP
jgi:hypothetical protein